MALRILLSSTVADAAPAQTGRGNLARKGNLKPECPLTGRDEVAALAKSFNQMASQLQAADEKQRELERPRNDLIAWVSHDLQTPLTSVRAILEAARMAW